MPKDFPNNFDRYQKIPAEKFKDISYEEFMDWKVAGWELPALLLVSLEQTTSVLTKLLSTFTNVMVMLSNVLISSWMTSTTLLLSATVTKSVLSQHENSTNSLMTSLKKAQRIEELAFEIAGHTHRAELENLIISQILDDN